MNYGSCGRWRNGQLVAHCTMAGTEECDFECPYRDAPDDIEDQREHVADEAVPSGVKTNGGSDAQH